MLATTRALRFLTHTLAPAFPYQFGGVEPSPNRVNMIGQTVMKFLYKDSLAEGFDMAYHGILEALAEGDLQYLKDNCEHNLVDNLKFLDCRVANPESHVVQTFTFIKVITGAAFQRTQKLERIDNQQFVAEIKFPVGSMLDMFELYRPRQKKMQLIIQLGIDFTSPYKLIRGSDSPTSTPETHNFQFESVTQLPVEKLGNINPKSNMASMMSMLQGTLMTPNNTLKEYTWKISDIDHCLKGNPWG